MVKAGDDLAALIVKGLDDTGFKLADGDILVVCQKIVSKSEGRVVNLKDFEPSEFAKAYARRWEKDPRAIATDTIMATPERAAALAKVVLQELQV